MTTFVALKLPGATDAPVADPNHVLSNFGNIGGFLGGTTNSYGFYDIVLWISLVLMFSWMVWGVFQYLLAGGNKENLAKARSRITWAIVGFVIVIMAYTIQKYAREIFPPQDVNKGNVQEISPPPPIIP